MLFDNRTLQVSLWLCRNDRWNIDDLATDQNWTTDLAWPMQFLTFPSALSQVNFYTDHTKIILSKTSDSLYLLTYISKERVSYSYPLNVLSEWGCSPELRQRLHYVVQLLQHYTNAWWTPRNRCSASYYNLLLTASIWEAKKKRTMTKKIRGSFHVATKISCPWSSAGLFELWCTIFFFYSFFATEPTPTVSHYQLDSQCAQPKFEPVHFI